MLVARRISSNIFESSAFVDSCVLQTLQTQLSTTPVDASVYTFCRRVTVYRSCRLQFDTESLTLFLRMHAVCLVAEQLLLWTYY